MSYAGAIQRRRGSVGAGPGPGRTFYVDAPLPWGQNTPVTIPVQALADASWDAAKGHIEQTIQAASHQISSDVNQAVTGALNDAIASGAVVVQKISWTSIAIAGFTGLLLGFAGAKLL
jgi:ElaB/YqjD/DUF883 family membrane-anchored ribosome-binding protein